MGKLDFCALDVKSAERLRRLCGKFGGDYETERAFAALQADKLIRANGLTWDLILGGTTSTASPSASSGGHYELCVEALSLGDMLNDAEREFLRNISSFNEISEKQRAWLDRIIGRLRAKAA